MNKFNKSYALILSYFLFSILLLGCGDKSNSDLTKKTATPKETFDECYARVYEKISNDTAKELIEEKKYKTKNEIPEQELVPQGLRMTIEDDCKANTKK